MKTLFLALALLGSVPAQSAEIYAHLIPQAIRVGCAESFYLRVTQSEAGLLEFCPDLSGLSVEQTESIRQAAANFETVKVTGNFNSGGFHITAFETPACAVGCNSSVTRKYFCRIETALSSCRCVCEHSDW